MSAKSRGRHTHPLRIPSFRWLWGGEALSAVGDQVVPVALAVMALDLGGGPAALGAIFAARVAAMLLFLLPAGILADRFSPTRVMMAADGLRLVVLLALASRLEQVPVGALPAVTFGLGAGEALSRPAFRALVPRVVGEANSQTANSLFSLTSWNSAIIGPGLGGLLVAAAGVRSTLLLDAATFAISMLTLLRVTEPPVVPRAHPSAFQEAREGIQAIKERPWILAVRS